MKKSNLVFISVLVLVYIFIPYVIGVSRTEMFDIIFLMLVVMFVSISPIGESILRVLYGFREVKTSKDREMLMLIFNEVYDTLKDSYKGFNPNIKLYIDNSMNVNACALGTNTIAVTRGAIQMLSKDELRGIIAHEFGHIKNGDTLIPLLLIVGNGIIAIPFLFLRFAALLIGGIAESEDGDKRTGNLLNGIVNILSILLFNILIVLLSISKRQNEYDADKFAFINGYGDNLTKALYTLKNFDISQKMSILDRLKSSHPYIDDRIYKLESYAEDLISNDDSLYVDKDFMLGVALVLGVIVMAVYVAIPLYNDYKVVTANAEVRENNKPTAMQDETNETEEKTKSDIMGTISNDEKGLDIYVGMEMDKVRELITEKLGELPNNRFNTPTNINYYHELFIDAKYGSDIEEIKYITNEWNNYTGYTVGNNVTGLLEEYGSFIDTHYEDTGLLYIALDIHEDTSQVYEYIFDYDIGTDLIKSVTVKKVFKR